MDDKELEEFVAYSARVAWEAFIAAAIVALMLIMLTGCGGGGGDDDKGDSQPATWQPVDCKSNPEKCK